MTCGKSMGLTLLITLLGRSCVGRNSEPSLVSHPLSQHSSLESPEEPSSMHKESKKPVSEGNLFIHRTMLNKYIMLGSCCVLHGYQAVGVLQ